MHWVHTSQSIKCLNQFECLGYNKWMCSVCVCVFLCWGSMKTELHKHNRMQLSYAAMYSSDVHPLSLRMFICMVRTIGMPVGQRCSTGPAPSDAVFAEHGGPHNKSHLLSEGTLVSPAASSLHCVPQGLVTARIDRLHGRKLWPYSLFGKNTLLNCQVYV